MASRWMSGGRLKGAPSHGPSGRAVVTASGRKAGWRVERKEAAIRIHGARAAGGCSAERATVRLHLACRLRTCSRRGSTPKPPMVG